MVKGHQLCSSAKEAGFKAELTKIKITSEAFEKYSHVKDFIKDDSVRVVRFMQGYSKNRQRQKRICYSRLAQNRFKMNSTGKRRYKSTLKSVNDYNALIQRKQKSPITEKFFLMIRRK